MKRRAIESAEEEEEEDFEDIFVCVMMKARIF
jgi:hypothetical protein